MEYEKLQDTLQKYAKYVIQQSRTNLTKDGKGAGNLYKSLNYNIETEVGAFLLEFLMEDYGKYVDRGVRGKTSTYPETASAQSKFQYGTGTGKKGGLRKGIREWLGKKRFQFRDTKGRFMSYDTMTFLISRSIYNKGLKANLFFTKPLERGLDRLGDDLINSMILDIEQQIILGIKK